MYKNKKTTENIHLKGNPSTEPLLKKNGPLLNGAVWEISHPQGIPANEDVREALSASATKGQQIMYDYVDSVSKNPTPKEYNVLSPDGQDQVQDNYLNYIQQVVSGEITAAEAADKTYADAQAIFK